MGTVCRDAYTGFCAGWRGMDFGSFSKRERNDSLSGIGDIMDDMTLDNISLTIGCLFPMRFLANGFKSSDR